MHYHETITNMTILVHFKENVTHNQLVNSVQVEYIQHWGIVTLMQIAIIFSMTFAIFKDDTYKLEADREFSYLVMKVVCSAALHIMICPEVAGTMDMFKYTINQCHLFEKDSEFTVQFLAFVSLIINIVAEILNIYMLTYQHNIVFVLMEVVCLEIIIELPSIYMSSLV